MFVFLCVLKTTWRLNMIKDKSWWWRRLNMIEDQSGGDGVGDGGEVGVEISNIHEAFWGGNNAVLTLQSENFNCLISR